MTNVLHFRPRQHDQDGPTSIHWLIFSAAREVTGCACGFEADESDLGWGDSVVDHLLSTWLPVDIPVHPARTVRARWENEASPTASASTLRPGSNHQPVNPGRG